MSRRNKELKKRNNILRFYQKDEQASGFAWRKKILVFSDLLFSCKILNEDFTKQKRGEKGLE